jgi:hypothetical protein
MYSTSSPSGCRFQHEPALSPVTMIASSLVRFATGMYMFTDVPAVSSPPHAWKK